MKKNITLAEGAGGKEMNDLISSFGFTFRGRWKNFDDDSATIDIGNNRSLIFTTDSYTVDPIFFPGGNIGELAVNGTINDLLMMGADPLGLSLGLVIEEGFDKLDIIIASIKKISEKMRIPIATGDTKVVDKGKLDKLIINVSGVGISDTDKLFNKKIVEGDKILISGGIGEHAVALLSKRFDFRTEIISDTKNLVKEIDSVKDLIKQAKDPTRGGIASCLNEISAKNNLGILVDEKKIPIKPQVRNVVKMLGLEEYELASEGRFICVCSEKNSLKALEKLKRFNDMAAIIGKSFGEEGVVISTMLGMRRLNYPTGRIVPRIC